MPRGIKGSGPFAGRGKNKKATSLAEIAARSGNNQTGSDGVTTGSRAAAATGRGRTGKGRRSATAKKSNARRGKGATGSNGQQRSEQALAPASSGSNQAQPEINGVKIEVMTVPGRGGRPQQSEAYPFAALDLATKDDGGELVGPSFLIPEDQNPDNVLAAARKRHKGKTFTARKMEGGVRIWRIT